MESTRTTRRRYPRRRLHGPVPTLYSQRVKFPKFHLVADCDGFTATPDEARATRVFTDATAAGIAEEGRPCRMCALESVLISVLDPKPTRERDVLVTFTSQANPKNPDASVFHFDWFNATPSGSARLRRLARRGRLSVTSTCSGPVAYGLVSEAAAAVLARNLRTVVIGASDAIPRASTIEVLWTLLGDNPPELAEAFGEISGMNPWEVATLLTMD